MLTCTIWASRRCECSLEETTRARAGWGKSPCPVRGGRGAASDTDNCGPFKSVRLSSLLYCVLVGLIEGRRVERWEVIGMLERTRRQQRMVRTRRLDQGVAWFNERPP